MKLHNCHNKVHTHITFRDNYLRHVKPGLSLQKFGSQLKTICVELCEPNRFTESLETHVEDRPKNQIKLNIVKKTFKFGHNMSIGADLTKLRATAAVLGLYCILPLILLVVLVTKIFSRLCSLLGCKSHQNVAGEVAVVSNIT